MRGGADETEQLPEVSGLVPPSEALVWTGNQNLPPAPSAAGSMVGGSAIQPL